MRLYLLGVFFLSLLTGLLIGLSKSPVVGAFIPLAFGLLAGAGGAFPQLFRREGGSPVDPEAVPPEQRSPAPETVRRALGLVLIAVATGAGAGALYGMLLREDMAVADLVPAWNRPPLVVTVPSNMAADGLVDLALLERLLVSAGVERRIRERIVVKFGEVAPADKVCPEIENRLKERITQVTAGLKKEHVNDNALMEAADALRSNFSDHLRKLCEKEFEPAQFRAGFATLEAGLTGEGAKIAATAPEDYLMLLGAAFELRRAGEARAGQDRLRSTINRLFDKSLKVDPATLGKSPRRGLESDSN